MNIEIKRLSSELSDDWLNYFDKIAFSDHGDWAFCYCLEGLLDRKTHESWTNNKERRAKAEEFIKKGIMQGYLAYHNGEVVGWCNVNDRKNYPYLTELFHAMNYVPDVPAKSIYCFLIAPNERGKGIAQAILEKVCEDAKSEGYTYIEAYPFADSNLGFQYHGTSKMYERNGFVEVRGLEFINVMQKRL